MLSFKGIESGGLGEKEGRGEGGGGGGGGGELEGMSGFRAEVMVSWVFHTKMGYFLYQPIITLASKTKQTH